MTKWKDITRSTKPLDWKKILDRVVMTPERLNVHLEKMIKEMKERKNK